MARARSKAQPAQTTTTGEETHMASADDLAFVGDILAGSRSRTNSGAVVSDFLDSGELFREVNLTSGSFAGKEPKKVKTALDNARKKMNDDGKLVIADGINVAVRIKDGKVFLINTTLFAAAQEAAA